MKKGTQPVVNLSKQFDTQKSLAFLREFYLEARKELKKELNPTVHLEKNDEACNLTFITDQFNLSLVITEGDAL